MSGKKCVYRQVRKEGAGRHHHTTARPAPSPTAAAAERSPKLAYWQEARKKILTIIYLSLCTPPRRIEKLHTR